MGIQWSYMLEEKMGNLFSSKIGDLLPTSKSSKPAWSRSNRSHYSLCTENEIELKPLPIYTGSSSDLSCDKYDYFDDSTIYVDIQNGHVILEDHSPCLPELISQGLLSGARAKRQTLESFDERSWRQSFPQTMVFAVELYYNMHIIR